MMSPDIVMGISLLMLFVLAGLTPGFLTLLAAHVTFCVPFVIVLVHARISGFDPAVVDAARDLGAREQDVFFRIILPMILPAVLAGWLLSFTLSIDDVIISFFVTGPGFEILPLKIYSMVKLGVTPEVNALCTVLFLLTLAAVFAAHILTKERKK
jgi:spermidine/putrescine transport system permease protein